jgi:hypothetical protein
VYNDFPLEGPSTLAPDSIGIASVAESAQCHQPSSTVVVGDSKENI